MSIDRKPIADFCTEMFGTKNVVAASFSHDPPRATVVALGAIDTMNAALLDLLSIDAGDVVAVDIDRRGVTVWRRDQEPERIEFEDS